MMYNVHVLYIMCEHVHDVYMYPHVRAHVVRQVRVRITWLRLEITHESMEAASWRLQPIPIDLCVISGRSQVIRIRPTYPGGESSFRWFQCTVTGLSIHTIRTRTS